MDSPVTKLIFIAAAVAASVLVVAIMWTTLGSNAPQTDDTVKYDKIKTKTLCEAVDGNWTQGTKTCAAKP
ncbi:hypothetical protein [Candidatus Poriferisodalis sp.]|uniref:hypothetical protein n=1 Tax=Candidatus Poriferisodalis sp. TaxID=3101277 RepID=UPI003B59B1C2